MERYKRLKGRTIRMIARDGRKQDDERRVGGSTGKLPGAEIRAIDIS